MHSMSEWNRVYGDLMKVNVVLHETDVVNSLAEVMVKVLLMLVEDKIKEMQK